MSYKLIVALLTSASVAAAGIGNAAAAGKPVAAPARAAAAPARSAGGGVHMGGIRAGGVGAGGFHAGHAAVNRSFARPGVVNHAHAFTPRSVTTPGVATSNAVNRANALNRSNAFNRSHALNSNAINRSNAFNRGATANTINSPNAATARSQFAHNRLAARNFHGLHNFNRTGFNRNAFGNAHSWNHWGGRFWGAGWNNWGGGWGGWAGPVFWPYLYGDIFSYALWPYGYYDSFWAFGPGFLLASIFAPGPYFGPDYYGYADSPDVYYGSTSADQRANARTSAAAAQSCNGLAPGVTDLPIAQIRKTVQPTADQSAALDALSTAADKANNIVVASCPNDIPLTPVARLDSAEKRVEAMTQAVQIVRDPLGKFYDSLSDEQRQKFDAIGSAETGHESAAPQDIASLCGPQPGDVAALPVQRIEQVVQPNAQQQAAFDNLKQVSQKVTDDLSAACPAQAPQTPVARLNAVKTRLEAMLTAMKTVRPPLQAFYASLSDEQKAKFNTLGPPQSASATPNDEGAQQ
jgi:hypothetical protein